MPPWFTSSLGNTRRGWMLGLKSPMQGPPIMGHVHIWHMQTSRGHKVMIRKVGYHAVHDVTSLYVWDLQTQKSELLCGAEAAARDVPGAMWRNPVVCLAYACL